MPAFFSSFFPFLIAVFVFQVPTWAQTEIPLPEHPRPDLMRPDWVNLNGYWDFRFDPEDVGTSGNWSLANTEFDQRILVPFPWGSPLSEVDDEAPIAWYRREITIPEDWAGSRPFLVIGASDWHTTVWLDGEKLGEHEGGYTPFEFDLSDVAQPGRRQNLVVRVDDVDRPFTLEGKQGYGEARGIWQTPYLEKRGQTFVSAVRFYPDLSAEEAGFSIELSEPAPAGLNLELRLASAGDTTFILFPDPPEAGTRQIDGRLDLPDPRLWTLDDPHLYDVQITLASDEEADRVQTYFGMREISVVDLPGTDHRYVALNGQPVYLQMALDQAYHPEGYYTFPSDAFMRDEVLRSKRIGLNGMRIHVKIGHPRKLYWADRLGMLIMADVPNSWGQPDEAMRREIEYGLRQMVRRDFNHPSIFSWVIFNETWGLYTDDGSYDDKRYYLPETKQWVVDMYELAKQLDPTRLVEDNSVCCGVGHTETDLNTWHSYLPGWAWEDHLARIDSATFEGSTWNMEEGYAQGRQPNLNSEFGNVWGYEGSTGDVDWSWDYHRAVNAFRRYPAIAGWLYTEHHDVINEWNGYWKYDRSEKFTGMEDLVPGMSLQDLHAAFYLSPGVPLSQQVVAGSRQTVPLYATFFSGRNDYGGQLRLRWEALFRNDMGEERVLPGGSRAIAYTPWQTGWLDEALEMDMPDESGLLVLRWVLETEAGMVLHRNFTTFLVEGGASSWPGIHRLTFAPADFAEASWSEKQWEILDGLKVNGAGSGHFTYHLPWPEELSADDLEQASLLFEASSKPLLGKDREAEEELEGGYMRGGGYHDPSRNPNAYPMTDTYINPSLLSVSVNEVPAGMVDLPDDPADHRGILSWQSQRRDRKLREAGTYGYKVVVAIPREALRRAEAEGRLTIRMEVPEALPGGLALYGARFGRLPFDPTVLMFEKP